METPCAAAAIDGSRGQGARPPKADPLAKPQALAPRGASSRQPEEEQEGVDYHATSQSAPLTYTPRLVDDEPEDAFPDRFAYRRRLRESVRGAGVDAVCRAAAATVAGALEGLRRQRGRAAVVPLAVLPGEARGR